VNNRALNSTDPSGLKIKPINSVYRMNEGVDSVWNDPQYKLGNSSQKFREGGCLLTTVVNTVLTYNPSAGIDPAYINDQKLFFPTESLPGDLDTTRVFRIYGLEYSQGDSGLTGKRNMDEIIELQKAEDEYGVIARVLYDYERDDTGNLVYRAKDGKITTADQGTTTELLHFVGVRTVYEGEIDGESGRWIEAAAASTSDKASDWFSTNRPLSSWKQKDGKVYIREDAIRRVDKVKKVPDQPRNGGYIPE